MVGLGTAIVHGAVLLGDRYANYTPAQLLIPFGSPLARLPVGLGQIGMYGLVLVVASFFIKQQIGRKTWRLIHFGSFAVFFLALIHGLASGTDTSAGSVQLLYWVSGGSVLFLTLFRVLMARWGMRPARGPAQRTPTA
jgi:predicted ferric reductase